jgi:hypothetical protein
MNNVMWEKWELDFVHISRFISQSCTKEKDGCAEVCLDVQAIVLVSLEVSTDVSEIRPTPASGNVEETGWWGGCALFCVLETPWCTPPLGAGRRQTLSVTLVAESQDM